MLRRRKTSGSPEVSEPSGASVQSGAGGGGGGRYRMREKLISIGDDFTIENAQGQSVYYVDGKILRIRNQLIFKDMQGNELATIQERMVTIKDTYTISCNGQVIATVKKALINPLRQRFSISVPGGEDMEAQGNILNYEYTIQVGRRQVAEVSKKWFRVANTYGVEIAPGNDDVLLLACTVVIDMLR